MTLVFSIIVMVVAFVGSLAGLLVLLFWGWEPSHFLIAAVAFAGMMAASALWLRIFVDDAVRKDEYERRGR